MGGISAAAEDFGEEGAEMLPSRRTPAPFRTWTRVMMAAATPLALGACQASAPAHDGAVLQPAAAIIDGRSNAFIGLDGPALSNAFGQPQLVRSEPPAEVWQYAGFDCVVDFYLYDSDGALRVAYVEARDMRAGSAATERCVKTLLQWVSTAPATQAL